MLEQQMLVELGLDVSNASTIVIVSTQLASAPVNVNIEVNISEFERQVLSIFWIPETEDLYCDRRGQCWVYRISLYWKLVMKYSS